MNPLFNQSIALGQPGTPQFNFPELGSPSVPPSGGDWMQGFAPKTGTPSFMQSGFAPGSPAGGGNWWDGVVGTKDQPGWGGMALGGASTLASAFMGMQQYGLAKQQLAENKRQFDTNFGAQKTLTNSNLEDRQRARVASNPGAYQSVGTYMTANGVK